jgi:hypothetical protein
MSDFLALIAVAVLVAVNLSAVLMVIAAATGGDEVEGSPRHRRDLR